MVSTMVSLIVNNYAVTINNLSTNTWIVNYLDNDETRDLELYERVCMT